MSNVSDILAQAMAGGRVPFPEDDLADKFSTEHRDDLRYCHDWGRWLEWAETQEVELEDFLELLVQMSSPVFASVLHPPDRVSARNTHSRGFRHLRVGFRQFRISSTSAILPSRSSEKRVEHPPNGHAGIQSTGEKIHPAELSLDEDRIGGWHVNEVALRAKRHAGIAQ